MTKKDLENVETAFLEATGLEKKDSSVTNKYQVETVNGTYEAFFDYEGMKSIFGRFQDPDKIKQLPTNPFREINRWSGKMNFHGEDCENFVDTISEFLAQ